MKQATSYRERSRLREPGRRDPVKLTALLYLREALLEERYEDCPEFIEVALEFGAVPFEIDNILEDPRRKPV